VARLHVRHLVRSDGFAGVERYVTYVAPELVRLGHEVSVVGGDPARMRQELAGTGVTFAPARTVAQVARAAMASPRPDLLHAHMTAAELAAVVAGYRLDCPVVATLHFGAGRGHSPLTRRVYRAIESRLDLELAVSRYVADGAGSGVGVLPPGIPDPLQHRGAPDLAMDAEAPPGRVVLVAQRLEPEKDTDVALHAWVASGLGARGWSLHVAGDGSCATDLCALAERIDPTSSIRFIGPRSELIDDLSRASIVLAPTPGEAFGLTVVEAMACGRPVIAAGAGGHLESVGPAGHDLLFAPGDVDGAASRLLRLAEDAAARDAAGRDLRRRFEAEYRIEDHAERLTASYRRLLGGTPHAERGDPTISPAAPSTRSSVAFVFPTCSRHGGVERVVRELARRCAQTYDVTFVGDHLDPEGMGAVAFDRVGGRRALGVPAPLSFRRRATRALAANRFDAVVTFGVECPPGDVAVVGSVHRAWLEQSGAVPTPLVELPARVRFVMPRHLALLSLERRYFRDPRLRAVLATSPATADEVVRTYSVRRDLVTVMPNGYDPAEFNAGVRATHRVEQRARLGLTEEVVLLFVANELHRKGFATLIDAVARTGDRRLRIEMVGRAAPDPYLGQIEALGLVDRVRWNGAQSDVAPWYAAADLLVLPTVYEPFGNVIVEALACGLPVVTSSAAGAAPAVVPGVNGQLLRDPRDADELGDVLAAATTGDTLEHWSRNTDVKLHAYRWDVVAEQLIAVVDAQVRMRS
jgi:glycosyltransferase involved in cell wall biosynthesis